MQDLEKLQEIEKLGEDEGLEEEEVRRGGSSYSIVPLLQAAICAIVLLALVFFKYTDDKTYQTATQWYQSEAVQEIELPKWNAGKATPSPAPSPSPASTPPTLSMDGAALQRI